MFNKIYIGLLAVAVIIASILIYFSFSWLLSIGDPAIAADNFQQYSRITWTYIWVSFLILLILANYLLYTTGKVWFIWSSFAYFGIFIVIHTFWLSQSLRNFQENNNLPEDVMFSPFVGIGILLAVGIAVFFDQYIVLRLRDKLTVKEQDI